MDKIKFTHAQEGEIECSAYDSGNTEFTNLPLLFAFALTKSIKTNGSACWYDYHTDLDGLKLLEHKSSVTIESIADTLASINMMTAYASEDVGHKHIRNMHWLAVGLSDLLVLISRENAEITNALSVLNLSNQSGLDAENVEHQA